MGSRAQGPASICEDAAELAVLPSPVAPWKGAPLRVVFAAENPLEGELSLIAPDGSVAAKSRERHGGPPYFGSPRSLRRPRAVACDAHARPRAGRVQHDHARHRRARRRSRRGRARWRAASGRCATPGIAPTENLFSAWIEKLFDAPLDAAPSWPALHEVLRDPIAQYAVQSSGSPRRRDGARHSPRLRRPSVFPARLFRVQDGTAVRVCEMLARRRRPAAEVPRSGSNIQNPEKLPARRPDRTRCRAGLPPRPPSRKQGASAAADRAPAAKPRRAICAELGLAASFAHICATVGDAVHSGSVRTPANDDNTDYYPVPLTQETLRPGTVYADPYGHVLMIVRRVPQTDDAAGVIPRRRRAARRDGRAQAFLARQFPVRAGSRARQPRLQALPADRAREERRLAAADQRRNREKSAVRRLFARPVASSRSKTSTIEWMT